MDRKVIQIFTVVISTGMGLMLILKQQKLNTPKNKVLFAPLLWFIHIVVFYGYVFFGKLGPQIMIWSASVITHGVITVGFLAYFVVTVCKFKDG